VFPHRSVLILLLAIPTPALATEWEMIVRSAFRLSSGVESAHSPIAYSGASWIDQSIALSGYPHQALGMTAEVTRYVPMLRLEGAVAPVQEIWQGGAGMVARANLGASLAEAHLGYALAQLPSVVRGPGTPAFMHGPRFALGLGAALPAGFGMSVRASVLLPFVSIDGRGDHGDGDAFELRIGIEKRIAAVAGKHVSVRLDVRRRVDSLRGASVTPISRLVAHSIGLSLSWADIPGDAQ
jgi:hypothetical protein